MHARSSKIRLRCFRIGEAGQKSNDRQRTRMSWFLRVKDFFYAAIYIAWAERCSS